MRFALLLSISTIHLACAQHSVLSSTLTTSSRAQGQTGICDWNPLSGLMNASHLGSLENHGFGLESHNYYFIEGLYTLAVHGAYKMDATSGFGVQLISDGSADLRDWLFALSYGRKLGAKTGIGLSIDYLQTQTPESKDLKNISFELGLQTQLLPTLLVGFVLKNPIPVKTSALYPYPVLFKAGLNYKVHEQLQVLAEIQKHGNQKTSFNFGIRYVPVLPFAFSTGVSTLGPSLSLGATFNIKSGISLLIAFEDHTVLGLSSSFGFNYHFR